MVDTSESMFPYFDDLMNYLVQDLLADKLHRGDTFHLLSFASSPEVEIALEMNSEEAAQRAFGRILLLHALGRYTDLVGGAAVPLQVHEGAARRPIRSRSSSSPTASTIPLREAPTG